MIYVRRHSEVAEQGDRVDVHYEPVISEILKSRKGMKEWALWALICTSICSGVLHLVSACHRGMYLLNLTI